MSVDLVVRDAIKAALICSIRHPGAGLGRSGWIADGIKSSLAHAHRFAFAGNPTGFASHVCEYVSALVRAGEREAAEIVSSAQQRKENGND